MARGRDGAGFVGGCGMLIGDLEMMTFLFPKYLA
jgi:hypothetical protein